MCSTSQATIRPIWVPVVPDTLIEHTTKRLQCQVSHTFVFTILQQNPQPHVLSHAVLGTQVVVHGLNGLDQVVIFRPLQIHPNAE